MYNAKVFKKMIARQCSRRKKKQFNWHESFFVLCFSTGVSFLFLLFASIASMSASSVDTADKKNKASSSRFPTILKQAGSWIAVYDKKKNRYLGRICFRDREGETRLTFQIPKKVFEALDPSSESKGYELIKKGRKMARFEDTKYGTPGPVMVKYDKEGEEGWRQAYLSALDELESRFDEGDETALQFWQVFAECSKPVEKRSHFLIKAAELGIPGAQKELFLAYCYPWGKEKYGIPLDFEKGQYWAELAAEKGTPEDQSYLACLFEEGTRMTQDLEKAVYWRTKAAEAGYGPAQMKLARDYKNGNGVPQDKEKSARWYTKLAEAGDVEAQVSLGIYYAEGSGVPHSDEKAAYWFTKAAEQGDCAAQFNMGVFHEKGRGVEQNYEKALHWYTQSAKQGFTLAQYNLGWLYKNGQGTEKNLEETRRWWDKAARNGFEKAQKQLDSLREEK